MRDDVVGTLCQLISETSTLHTYCVRQLWLQIGTSRDLHTVQPLVQVAMWCIGEFSDQINDPLNIVEPTNDQELDECEVKSVEKNSDSIFDPLSPDMSDLLIDISNPISSALDSPVDLDKKFYEKGIDEDGSDESLGGNAEKQLNSNSVIDNMGIPVDERDLVERCQDIINDPKINIATKEYAISALFKLSARFPNQTARVKVFVDGCTTDLNIELQQRSIEFSTLFSRHGDKLPSIFERMPPIERPAKEEEDSVEIEGETEQELM